MMRQIPDHAEFNKTLGMWLTRDVRPVANGERKLVWIPDYHIAVSRPDGSRGLIERAGWWEDDPLASLIARARRAVCWYASFGVVTRRIVVEDATGCDLFVAELHPSRVRQMLAKR